MIKIETQKKWARAEQATDYHLGIVWKYICSLITTLHNINLGSWFI